MNAFLERLRGGPTLVLDGGLGSMLIARGLARGAAPESWVLERPLDVTAVHRAYVEAGSEAVHACTFGGNPVRLGRYGLADRCAEINAAAVRLARDAQPRFVIADVGPTGEYLSPVGKADADEWRRGFELQGAALAEAGPDALHIETMTDLREALIALEALRASAPAIPILVSLTFERKKRGFYTIMGDPLAKSLQALAAAGADAAGANCSIASGDMHALAQEARSAVDLPLVMQPNAGSPLMEGDKVRYAQTPQEYADDAAAIAAMGIEAVGGCCGTDPRFIAELHRRLGPRRQHG